jgi:hypothetical protein
MPSVTDPETMNVDDLPGVWTPIQWDMNEAERLEELETQATASLLFAVDAPEAILRLLLDETKVERAYEPPPGFDQNLQGDWDPELVSFIFTRPIRLLSVERKSDFLRVEYNFEGLGHWVLEIEPERVNLSRV